MPIRVTEVLENIFGRFSGVIAIVISIPAYDVASSCRCLRVADDTIDNELAIYVWIAVYLFLLVFAVFVVSFAAPFSGFVGVCSAGHPIYADGVFDSVLHDPSNLGSDTYNLIRTKSTGRKF